MSPPKVFFISGPTASGKSQAALTAASQLDGEIINADSIQVYKGFDIGSAKPSMEQLQTVPHHLVSTLEATEPFSAGDFEFLAMQAVNEISQRGKLPIVSGGTGLYLQCLINGIVSSERVPQGVKEIIIARENELVKNGMSRVIVASELHKWLEYLDPVTARHIHPHDTSRVKRALGLALNGQQGVITARHAHAWSGTSLASLVIILAPSRKCLYQGIELRVDEMFRMGFVEEVNKLLRKQEGCKVEPEKSGLPKPLLSIGYRRVVDYLREGLPLGAVIQLIKRDSKRFAKRQLTWWRNAPIKLQWVSLSSRFPDAARCETREQCLEFCKQIVLRMRTEDLFPAVAKTYYLTIGSGLEELI